MKRLFQRSMLSLQTTTLFISLVAWSHWKWRNYFPFFFLDRTWCYLILSILRNHSLIILLSSYAFGASCSFLFSRSYLIFWWRGRLNMNGTTYRAQRKYFSFSRYIDCWFFGFLDSIADVVVESCDKISLNNKDITYFQVEDRY